MANNMLRFFIHPAMVATSPATMKGVTADVFLVFFAAIRLLIHII